MAARERHGLPAESGRGVGVVNSVRKQCTEEQRLTSAILHPVSVPVVVHLRPLPASGWKASLTPNDLLSETSAAPHSRMTCSETDGDARSWAAEGGRQAVCVTECSDQSL